MPSRRRNRRHRRQAPYTSLYSAQLTREELRLIAAYNRDLALHDEIWALRVLNRRLVACLHPAAGLTLTLPQRLALTSQITNINGRIARLVRLQAGFDQADAQARAPLSRLLATAFHDLSHVLSQEALAELHATLPPDDA